MDISTVLVADLHDLTATLDTPTPLDLAQSLRWLIRDATLAVRSLLGLTLTVTLDNHPVTLTSMMDWVEPADIATSLQVPLTFGSGPGARGLVVLYAGIPGAFVDLAADMQYALPDCQDQVRLDEHLVPSTASGLVGLLELSMANRAIGMLIQRGSTLEKATRMVRQHPPQAAAEQSAQRPIEGLEP